MQLNSISATMYLESAATLRYILLQLFQSSKWKLDAHFIAIAELVVCNVQIPEFLKLHLVLSILNRTKLHMGSQNQKRLRTNTQDETLELTGSTSAGDSTESWSTKLDN
jgi:hypothetical protein